MGAYIQLFASFFFIGLFTLGGGYAMLPLIEREVVQRRQWLPGPMFVDMLALAQVMPGPVALNTAVFVGHRRRGFAGALTAALGIVLPAFLVMLALVLFFLHFRDNEYVARVFSGLRPAVAAMIVATLPGIAKKAQLGWRGFVAAGLVVAALGQPWYPLSPAWVIVAAVLFAVLRSLSSASPPPPAPPP